MPVMVCVYVSDKCIRHAPLGPGCAAWTGARLVSSKLIAFVQEVGMCVYVSSPWAIKNYSYEMKSE